MGEWVKESEWEYEVFLGWVIINAYLLVIFFSLIFCFSYEKPSKNLNESNWAEFNFPIPLKREEEGEGGKDS